MRSKKPCSAAKSTLAIFVTLLLASIVVPAQTQAQKFKVLHTFHGANGGEPLGVLVRDSAGNIYGTTGVGGTGKCSKYGCGTAFKLNNVGKQVWLHSFEGANGFVPAAGLLRDAAGNLFGTTVEGGRITKACGGVQGGGCGVVFKLDSAGKETVLYKFPGFPSGSGPEALLVKDNAGNLYGTTYQGGTSNFGTVFKIDKSGKESILHSFAGPPDGGGDGALSYAGVIRDAAGNLYGVTAGGGAFGAGVVYEVDAAGKESLLYSFTGGSDGGGPESVLLFDSQGNLYGTTANGGNGQCGGTGCGVVFELSPHAGGTWAEAVLYTFCSLSNCADGERPLTGPLVRDSVGNLYGATIFGGTFRNCNGDGCGVVFKLDANGEETVLHDFTGGADGAFPFAGLAIDDSGNLYGTTQGGGATCFVTSTCGVVFKIVP
jgi:uncharacterized repeat protein (TIGR03803 family)